MSGNQRELTTTVGIIGMPETVARQRLATTNENHRKRPAAKAGVEGSNPAGGTSVMSRDIVDRCPETCFTRGGPLPSIEVADTLLDERSRPEEGSILTPPHLRKLAANALAAADELETV